METLRAKAGAIVLGLTLSGAPALADALILCSSPVKYLIICCPKPCPVIDYSKLALHAAQNIVDKARVELTAQHTETTRNTETSMGTQGPRATMTAVECPVKYEDVVMTTEVTRRGPQTLWGEDAINLENAGIIASDGDTSERRQGAAIGLERLAQRNTADTVIAAETLAMWTDAAAESAAKAGSAVAQATDARDLMRRIAEIRMEITRMDEIRGIAKALGESTRGSEELVARVRDR